MTVVNSKLYTRAVPFFPGSVQLGSIIHEGWKYTGTDVLNLSTLSVSSQQTQSAPLPGLNWVSPTHGSVQENLVWLRDYATLAYKALHTGQPRYLSELLHYEPTRTLWSSSSSQLSVPRHNLEFGSRAFQISAPKIWNLLPASIHNSPSLPTFCRHLKTHYFQSAYPNP